VSLNPQEFLGWLARIDIGRYDIIIFSDQMDKFSAMREFNHRAPNGVIKNIGPVFVATHAQIERITNTSMDEQMKAEHVMKLMGWSDANYIILKGS
jgi:hypothetical protein